MRSAWDIREAFNRLIFSDYYQCIMGVTSYVQPWWQALHRHGVCDWRPLFDDLVGLREEKVEQVLVDNGSMYWCRTKDFLEQKTFFMKDLGVHRMPYWKSIDINTEEDFRMAEFLAREHLKTGG